MTDAVPAPAADVAARAAGVRAASPTSRRGRPELRRPAVLATPGGVLGVVLLTSAVGLALLGPVVVGDRPFASVAAPLQAPSAAHVMGTDDLGRDVLTMVVHGLRTSLVIAVGVVAIAGVIAVCVGALAGSHPGSLDDLLMRGTELVQVVPRFFLAVVVVALFGARVSNVVLLLGVTSWTWTARVVRAETLSLRQRAFVEAARSFGAGQTYILRRHIAVSVLPTALVMLSVCASGAVLIEAGLGFVGLGDPDVVSLGSLASNAQRFLRSAWWLTLFPGAALLILILGINLVGDALGDAGSARLGPVGLGSTR
ncbi:MAG: ABC transporter permease [Actinobacteria bacterium]|nr:ABC transporter permease [Actinomycetota bacterium]